MKKLLIVVDYQNDFVTGALGFDKASAIEDNIEKRIKAFEEAKQDILFTLDTHREDYLKTVEGENLPIPHCIKGTDGHKVYGKIYPYSLRHLNIEKETFGSKELAYYLQTHHYDLIELVGLVSNICVISNAIICKTMQPNAEIIIPRNCTSSNNEELQEKTFDVLKNLHIKII